MNTTSELTALAVGTTVLDSDGDTWRKDAAGMWRQVGVFGSLGQSAFSSAHFLQGMGPIYRL